MDRVNRKNFHPIIYFRYLRNRIRRNPKAFRVYSILRLLVIAVLVRSIWVRNLESAAICILSLVLFLIPTFMERQLHVEIPATFQIIIYIFIFAAGIRMCSFLLDADALHEYVENRGMAGVLLFMGMNILQTLTAIIPAGPFEIAAGSAFGILKGTLICDAAMCIGSMISFALSRKFGMKFVSLFYSEDKLKNMKIEHAERKEVIFVILCYLVPGLPKDVMPYVLGMSDLSPVIFALIVFVCRIPGILLSVTCGDALIYRDWRQLVIAAVISVICYAVGIYLYGKYRKSK